VSSQETSAPDFHPPESGPPEKGGVGNSASRAPNGAELAALKAAAAQAAAEAAAARLAAAEAAVAAAEAAAREAEGSGPVPVAAGPTRSARPGAAVDAAGGSGGEPAPAAPSDSTGPRARDDQEASASPAWPDLVAQAYAFDGPALTVGALVVEEEAVSPVQVRLPLAMMNRHGLVAGATGTGKTRTLQAMAEGLSDAGVPVFLADIKGDLSGLTVAGEPSDGLLARAASVGQEWRARAFPVEFYSLGGRGAGIPIRTTVTDFGPLLLAKVLGLNATQESSLALVFHWADSQGLDLLDLADLRSTVTYLLSDEGKEQLEGIGGLSRATAGVILRELVGLQAQGADAFFGEPAFDSADLLRVSDTGRGIVSILELPGVQDRPALFSTFLMWLLADLFQDLPEVGDVDKPRLVFFFDEAHLLFSGASKDFLAQVTQTVRLIRSKGVGVFFVTQTPKDVPADVLAQLANRVQHALRAFTPDDAKALRATARTFPTSPYDLEKVLTSLGTGEAVITVLTEEGVPTPVAWTRLRAPESSMSPAPGETIEAVVERSALSARYATAVDAESAREVLAERVARQQVADEEAVVAERGAAEAERRAAEAKRAADAAARTARKQAEELERMRARLERDATRSRSRSRPSAVSDPLDAFLRSAGSQLGREITRTIFGTRRR
jgi:DNA helicase HerA-like ATPase